MVKTFIVGVASVQSSIKIKPSLRFHGGCTKPAAECGCDPPDDASSLGILVILYAVTIFVCESFGNNVKYEVGFANWRALSNITVPIIHHRNQAFHWNTPRMNLEKVTANRSS